MGGSCGTSTSLALPQAAAAGSSAEQDLLLAVLSAQVLIHIFWPIRCQTLPAIASPWYEAVPYPAKG